MSISETKDFLFRPELGRRSTRRFFFVVLSALAIFLTANPVFASSSTVLQLGNPRMSVEPGQSVTLAMKWLGTPQPEKYQVLVHFIDQNGKQAPFQGDHAPTPATTAWNGTISYSTTVNVPSTIPVGVYQVRVGLYRMVAPYSTRIPLIPGPGVIADSETRYTVGTLQVGKAQAQVQMLGSPNLSMTAGSTGNLAMRFNGVPMPESYQVLVHFVDSSGKQLPMNADHAPTPSTKNWNGPVAYNAPFSIPATIPAGDYSIRVGLYRNVYPYSTRIPMIPGTGVIADNETRYTVGKLTVLSSTPPPTPTPAPTPTPTPAPPAGSAGPAGQDATAWSMVFSDEFDNGFNTTKWNDHSWYETSNPTKNYSVENGALFIWPQRDGTGKFFNRTIDTDGKYSTVYGFFEAEAKLPIGKGTWPAFWLYAHPSDARPEIDIMEAYAGGGVSSGWSDANLHPNNFGMTLHKANADYSYHDVPYATKMRDFIGAIDLSAGFHKYGMKWEPSGITFYFDGKQIGPKYSDSSGYYNRPMYVLLDLWFGSASGTPDSTTPTGKGNSYIVNYVRVWKAK